MINVSQTVADKKVYFYSLDSVKNVMDLGIICAKYYTYVGEVETDLEQRGVVFHRNDGNEFFMTMKEETGVYFGKCYKLRNTNLPHVKNILNGNLKEIATEEYERLSEETHYLIDPSKKLLICEYNHAGPRYTAVVGTINYVLEKLQIKERVQATILLNKDIFRAIKDKNGVVKTLDLNVSVYGFSKISEALGSMEFLRSDVKSDDTKIRINGKISFNADKLKKGNLLKFANKVSQVLHGSNCSDDTYKKLIMGFEDEEGHRETVDFFSDRLCESISISLLSSNSKYIDSDEMYSELKRLNGEFSDDYL